MFYVGFLFSSTGLARVFHYFAVDHRLNCPERPNPPSWRAAHGVSVMAKGQVRSNKETRKPKAEKAKPAVVVGSSPFTQPPGKK